MQKINIETFESAEEFAAWVKKSPDLDKSVTDEELTTVYSCLMDGEVYPVISNGCLYGVSAKDGIFEMNLDKAIHIADQNLVEEEIEIDKKRKILNHCNKDISCMKCRIDRGFDIFGDIQ